MGADRSTQPLDELLKPFRQGDLEQLGRRYGLSLATYYSRNEVRQSVAQNITQAGAVKFALDQVRPEVKATYEWLLSQGGRATISAMREQLRASDVALSAMLHLLEDYALAFDTFSDSERIAFIPAETLENLATARKRPYAQSGLVTLDEPHAIRPGTPTFLWDLIAIVSAVTHQEVDLTRSGTLPKRTAQRLLPALVSDRVKGGTEGSLAYCEMLRQIALDLGIVTNTAATTKTRGRLKPGPALDSWARHDAVMQARRLLRRWVHDRVWQDLHGAHYRDWHAFYIEPQTAREQVLTHLRACKPGVWYSLASFRAVIMGDDPYVLRPRQRFAGEAGFRLADDVRAHWEETDGELITGIFSSTLAELGLVTLGYEGDNVPGTGEPVNPTSFMLTDLGYEALTSEGSSLQISSPRPLVLQPNFQVLVMEPSIPVLYMLTRFACLAQVGHVSRFTLTREALDDALDAGMTIERILTFLESATPRAVPQNIAYTLRDWARQHAREIPEHELMLEALDEDFAEEIITAPQLRAFHPQLIGSTRITFARQVNVDDLMVVLNRLGFSKKLRGGIEGVA